MVVCESLSQFLLEVLVWCAAASAAAAPRAWPPRGRRCARRCAGQASARAKEGSSAWRRRRRRRPRVSKDAPACPIARGQDGPLFHGPAETSDRLFPLTYLDVPEVRGRGTRRRRDRRMATRVRRANEAIYGFNCLAGYAEGVRSRVRRQVRRGPAAAAPR